MKRKLRVVGIVLGSVVLLVVGGALVGLPILRAKYGGGRRLEDRTTQPFILPSQTEIVADLDYPPGNIAVSKTGRIFLTYHPAARPPEQLVELIGVTPQAFVPKPSDDADKTLPSFRSILALRIDQQDRLWVLDYGHFGILRPRLLAFDVNTLQLVERYDFPSEVAGFLSMLNDFQVDPKGRKIYIADTSPILQKPAILVYDTVAHTSRRLLEGTPFVQAQDYIIQAPGRDMMLFDSIPLRIGLDSIALDKRGEYLYFGPLSGDRLYRIATKDLNDESLSAAELAEKVEDYGPKTISDGLSMDEDDNVYMTDPEHSAIEVLRPDRQLRTVLKDSPLRWPDGLSFAPNGWLYVTCSALHQVQFRRASEVKAHAPYQVIRFKPGPEGVPGQ
jgi:sugar lactone lactonase YvrE